MLRLLGVRLHPVLKALLGAALVAAGLLVGRPVIAVVGGALLLMAVLGGHAREDR